MSVFDEVFDELGRARASDRTVDLVLAAIDGDDALEAAIAGEVANREPAADVEEAPAPPSVYLTDIAVTGFRGIGPESTISFDPGPGLTVVVGRNGSGKSSFSDALEVALTGDSYRWIGKTAEWKDGWRNLHHQFDARVEARFQVEGVAGTTTVHRSWADNAKKVDDVISWAQHHGRQRTDLAGLGWADPLSLYRPLLSYSELGVIASTPSKIFDALSGVLGLEELNAATERLRQARLKRQQYGKDAKKQLTGEISARLEALDDERARTCHAALKGRSWDLEVVASAATGGAAPDSTLGALAELSGPTHDDIAPIVARLRSAQAGVDGVAGSDAANASHLAGLLAAAVEHHERHGDGPCPVCGTGGLDSSWRARSEVKVERLRREGERYDRAVAEARESVAAAKRLATPRHLPESSPIDLSDLQDLIAAFADAPATPGEAADHLATTGERVVAAYQAVKSEAGAAFSAAEEAWRPVALELASWLELARAARQADVEINEIDTAEKAAKAASGALRSRRFEPIASHALELWGKLRLQSNVELKKVDLSGDGIRRRVDLDVTVDGQDGAALGVVSQGEINCLALSLFFPRATLPESPFRFIVIDDPVQAMDPARVDGLARVLFELGQTRQVIVFTHDDRLPESLRRLNLEHQVIGVTRRPGSVVDTKRNLDPVRQYFLDARAVEKDQRLPDGVATKVVPGFCRSGIEAACMEAVRRRHIGRGDSHARVERLLSDAKSARELMALALFDDGGRTGDVLGELNRSFSPSMANAFQDCNRGAHGTFHGSLSALVDESLSLAERVRVQK